MTTTRFEWDTSEADAELGRLQDGFDLRDMAAFESVLYTAYVHTVQDVHVISGALVRSGDADVDEATGQKWQGHISYGDQSAGYAVYEAGKAPAPANRVARPKERPYHTDDHNFMRRTENIDEPMMAAVMAFFDRGHSTAGSL